MENGNLLLAEVRRESILGEDDCIRRSLNYVSSWLCECPSPARVFTCARAWTPHRCACGDGKKKSIPLSCDFAKPAWGRDRRFVHAHVRVYVGYRLPGRIRDGIAPWRIWSASFEGVLQAPSLRILYVGAVRSNLSVRHFSRFLLGRRKKLHFQKLKNGFPDLSHLQTRGAIRNFNGGIMTR